MVVPEEVVELLEGLSFDVAWHEEELGHGIRLVAIEDPHGQGIAINLVWTGGAITVTLGHGTVVDVRGGPSVHDFRALISDLLGCSSVERWSRSRHQLKVDSLPAGRRFSSSKGSFGGRLSAVRHYAPYRPRNRADREPQ